MLYHAKNKTIQIEEGQMDYIVFGNGTKNLIIIPGLGDGLKTVKGMAIPFAMMYKQYARGYKVYVFSRKYNLTRGYSTKDMAKDQATAMKLIGISKADIWGVSQGGMIAQYLAIDYPEIVDKLVLTVTLARQNAMVQSVIGSWMELAKKKDYKNLMMDTAEKTYTETYLKKTRWMYPILGRIGKPKSFERFLIMANACVHHDTYQELEKIKCPTYIIGACEDQVLGVVGSKELAEKIMNAKLVFYPTFGHGVYEEAKDFHNRVLNFLLEGK